MSAITKKTSTVTYEDFGQDCLIGIDNGAVRTSAVILDPSLTKTGNTLSVTHPYKGQVSGDFTGRTATVSAVTQDMSPNDGNPHQYQIGAYLNVTAISAGTVTITYTFTDENNVGRTLTMFPMGLTAAGVTATGFIGFPMATIRVKANTNIIMVATFTGVSVNYDVGGSIARIN